MKPKLSPAYYGLFDVKTNKETLLIENKITSEILDSVSTVQIIQEYKNMEEDQTELRYQFPLDDLSCVYSFKATIDGEIIFGKVFEKEVAKEKYKEALKEDKKAVLLESDYFSPDTFTISLGNFQKNTKIIIEISYITELIQTNDKIFRFYLPSTFF
jgi:hypothetical protein